MKWCLVVFLSIAFFSCAIHKPIEKQKPANNATYEVEYLFEYDGCKVYRFKDDDRYVYFTNCKGDVTNIGTDSASTRVTTITNQKFGPR